MSARSAYEAYRRALNLAVYGTEQPTPAEVGRWFDERFGLWLPPRLLKKDVWPGGSR